MTQKTYRTAQGKTIDFGAIILKNEEVRAVGNMNVNARGDSLNETNGVISSKSNQIQKSQARVSNVSSRTVGTSNLRTKTAPKVEKPKPVETPNNVIEVLSALDNIVTEEPIQIEEPAAAPLSGLSMAIARTQAKQNTDTEE